MAAGADGLRKFFVDALTGALDLGLAVPDDVLRHVTPDVLAAHLPRTLWGKLIAACLAAPRTDARLVVDTIGVPALCEHVPGSILWSIVADVATRALGKGLVAAPPPPAATVGVTAPAPAPAPAPATTPAPAASSVPTPIPAVASSPVPVAIPTVGTAPASAPVLAPVTPPVAKAPSTPPPRTTGSMAAMKVPTPTPPASVTTAAARAATATVTTTAAPPPSAVVDIDFDDDDEPAPLDAPPVSPHRATTVAGPGARGTPPPAAQPGNGRTGTSAGASSRRPQASATKPAGGRTMPASPRRGPSTSDFDLDTDVGTVSAKPPEDVPVDDDQLIDWSTSEETVTSGDSPLRKR